MHAIFKVLSNILLLPLLKWLLTKGANILLEAWKRKQEAKKAKKKIEEAIKDPDKKKTAEAMNNLFKMLVIVSLIPSCAHYESDFWAGDHRHKQIVNAEGKAVSCETPKFDEFGCLHYENILKLRDYIKYCTKPNCLPESKNELNGAINFLIGD